MMMSQMIGFGDGLRESIIYDNKINYYFCPSSGQTVLFWFFPKNKPPLILSHTNPNILRTAQYQNGLFVTRYLVPALDRCTFDTSLLLRLVISNRTRMLGNV